MRGMEQANLYLGVFQETKVTIILHMRESMGYRKLAANAPVRHQGGIYILYHDAPHSQVESYQLPTGVLRPVIVRCWLLHRIRE